MHDASMRLHLAAGLLMATELLEGGWSTEDEPGFICRSGQAREPIAIETWYALKALRAGCLIAESRLRDPDARPVTELPITGRDSV